MRDLKYLSPTSLATARKNIEEFYMQYLADVRAPRTEQTKPMAIGSAFDAYVKSYLYECLFGKGHNPDFSLSTILEKQVSPNNLSWAREHGMYVFNEYKSNGALADILLELQSSIGPPRFEFEIQGNILREATIEGVVFLGRPDIFFTNKGGANITFDWKVNGYCSPSAVSPKTGYIGLKPGWTMHKDCNRKVYKEFYYNANSPMESVDRDWAAQLTIYSWLCGQPVGSTFIAAIDQICCNTKNLTKTYPELRVAQHRAMITESYQNSIYTEAHTLWKNIKENWIFRDMTQAESIGRCQILDQRAKEMWGATDNESEEDKIFRELTTMRRFY